MRKIRRIFETTQEISFISPEKEFSLYLKAINESELGGRYQAIPWNEIVKKLKIKENKKGPDLIFSPQGMVDTFLFFHETSFGSKIISAWPSKQDA